MKRIKISTALLALSLVPAVTPGRAEDPPLRVHELAKMLEFEIAVATIQSMQCAPSEYFKGPYIYFNSELAKQVRAVIDAAHLMSKEDNISQGKAAYNTTQEALIGFGDDDTTFQRYCAASRDIDAKLQNPFAVFDPPNEKIEHDNVESQTPRPFRFRRRSAHISGSHGEPALSAAHSQHIQ
jgi:hypothetical protein